MANTDREEALRRIADFDEFRPGMLDLSDLDIDHIPRAIGFSSDLMNLSLAGTRIHDLSFLNDWGFVTQSSLSDFDISNTPVRDLSPIANQDRLLEVDLRGTKVNDLRPLLTLKYILGDPMNTPSRVMQFSNTPACQDPVIAAAAAIEDDEERVLTLVAHLRTLPPWPEPLPTKVGVQINSNGEIAQSTALIAQTQIAFLLEHAATSQITAETTASQIRFALRDVPATDGNKLPVVLRAMERVADILDRLGDSLAHQDPDAELIRRIAALETSVADLTRNLADAEKAKEAAEALANANGFWRSYRKTAGIAAGAGTVALGGVCGTSALVYVLGVEHPIIQALLTTLGKLPK